MNACRKNSRHASSASKKSHKAQPNNTISNNKSKVLSGKKIYGLDSDEKDV